MAFRWKNQIPELQPNFVDPTGVQQTIGQQGMQGYVPGVVTTPSMEAAQQMQGYNPNNVTPQRTPAFAGTPGNGAGYRFDASEINAYNAEQDRKQNIAGEIKKLQAELEQVNAQIAAIDKATPSIKANPKEWEIAAQRAEIGDMSAYDNLVSRANQNGASSTVSGIENGLYNAAKELWGMSDEDDSQRAISRNTIEVELQKAEDWARKNNVDIETGMPRIYYDLRQKYNELVNGGAPAASGNGSLNFENANSVKSQIGTLDREGNLSDVHIKAIDEEIKKNPNSKHAAELKAIRDEYKYKTKEAKKRAADITKKAMDNVKTIESKTPAEQNAFWQGLSKAEQKEMLKYGQWKVNNKTVPPTQYFERSK